MRTGHPNASILAVRFDGVIHRPSFVEWSGPCVVEGNPNPGALEWLAEVAQGFRVVLTSHRFAGPEEAVNWKAKFAVVNWLKDHGYRGVVLPYDQFEQSRPTLLELAGVAPRAFASVEDRAIPFRGKFPSLAEIQDFRPWTVAEPKATDA